MVGNPKFFSTSNATKFGAIFKPSIPAIPFMMKLMTSPEVQGQGGPREGRGKRNENGKGNERREVM